MVLQPTTLLGRLPRDCDQVGSSEIVHVVANFSGVTGSSFVSARLPLNTLSELVLQTIAPPSSSVFLKRAVNI